MVLKHKFEQTRFIIGEGALSELYDDIDSRGCKRIMVVAGETTGTMDELIKPILNALGKKHVLTYTGCRKDVPLPSVERGVALKQDHNIDGLVSLGGGSNHDTAKAIAELAAEDNGLHDIKARVNDERELVIPENDAKKIPIFTVATTFTGAEITDAVSVTDTKKGEKAIIVDEEIRPVSSAYLPSMTRTTPKHILAASGMNALNHAVEIMYSSTHGENPFYQATSEKAIPLLLKNVPIVVGDTPNKESLVEAHIGACLSALGITHGYCITHSINQAICARYPVHHGQGDSILLPYGVRFNSETVPERIHRIGRAMDVLKESESNKEAMESVVDRIHQFQKSLGLPSRLREVDVDRNEFEEVANQVLLNPGIKHNPREVTDQDVIDILRQAW